MTEKYLIIAINVALLLQIACLIFIAIEDKYIPKRSRVPLFVIGLLVLSLVITDQLAHVIGEGIITAGIKYPFMETVLSIYGYCMIPVITFMFFRIHMTERKRVPVWIVIVLSALIVISVIADLAVGIRLPVSFLTVAATSGSVFYFIWLHLRFVRDREQSMMTDQRIQIMMSQIQPHFLYNTLTTIQALCATNPDLAARTVEKFADYLRQNLSALSQTDLIPFNKELEHAKIYSEIELLMFPSLHMEYDIMDRNFRLPALSIQPLVENAIRHGIRGKKDGTIMIRTRREEENHRIEIIDNGKGFDTEAPPQGKGSHIGIKNVRDRIETMCDGTMKVSSQPGEGTKITIRIPIREIPEE